MFSLAENSHAKPKQACDSMTDYILYSLQPGPADLAELKTRIQRDFGEWLNYSVNVDSDLGTWEKTLRKKLRTCKNIISTPVVYTLDT